MEYFLNLTHKVNCLLACAGAGIPTTVSWVNLLFFRLDSTRRSELSVSLQWVGVTAQSKIGQSMFVLAAVLSLPASSQRCTPLRVSNNISAADAVLSIVFLLAQPQIHIFNCSLAPLCAAVRYWTSRTGPTGGAAGTWPGRHGVEFNTRIPSSRTPELHVIDASQLSFIHYTSVCADPSLAITGDTDTLNSITTVSRRQVCCLASSSEFSNI